MKIGEILSSTLLLNDVSEELVRDSQHRTGHVFYKGNQVFKLFKWHDSESKQYGRMENNYKKNYRGSRKSGSKN